MLAARLVLALALALALVLVLMCSRIRPTSAQRRLATRATIIQRQQQQATTPAAHMQSMATARLPAKWRHHRISSCQPSHRIAK